MLSPDIFVGAVTIGLGLFVCSAAFFNWDWYYELQKARWIQSICGRTGARVFFGIFGIGLIVLGAIIASGTFSRDSGGDGDRSKLSSPFPLIEPRQSM